MVIVTHYTLVKDGDGKTRIKKPAPVKCEKCGGWLSVHDRRDRKAINAKGEQVTYNLRRLQCKNCKKIHLEIPDCLVERKRYDAESVKNPDICAADDSTIRRWRRKGAGA